MKCFFANEFLDFLQHSLELKNDAALSKKLRVSPPVISKMRHGRLRVGPTILLRAHELTGFPVSEIRAASGDNRESFFD